MVAHTAENGTAAQPGTGAEDNPARSWRVILMSVLSCAVPGVISEYVTDALGMASPPCLSSVGQLRKSCSEPACCPRPCCSWHPLLSSDPRFWNYALRNGPREE